MTRIGLYYKYTFAFLAALLIFAFLVTPGNVFAQSAYSYNQAASQPTPTEIYPTLSPAYVKMINSMQPKTKAEEQLLEIFHQIQARKLPLINLYLLTQALGIPFLSLEAKLALYHFFSSLPFVSSIHLSPLWFSILALMLPSLTILVPIFLLVILYFFFRHSPGVIYFGLGRFNSKEEEKAYLELTFPSNTTKSALATEQLYKLFHTRGRKQSFFRSFIKHKKIYSLEIVSSRDAGIRYIMVVPKTESDLIHQNLLAYLPGLKVKEVSDYLDIELGAIITSFSKSFKKNKNAEKEDGENDEDLEKTGSVFMGVVDLKLSSDFALPLHDQKILEEHDPISFLTGNMTKLYPGELMAFQIVTTPVISSIQSKVVNRANKLKQTIAKGKPLTSLLQPSPLDQFLSFPGINILAFFLKYTLLFAKEFTLHIFDIFFATASSGKGVIVMKAPQINIPLPLNSYEQDLHQIVKEKLNQHLFETSIRVLIVVKDADSFETRRDSIVSSVGQFTSTYQSLTPRGSNILPLLSSRVFKQRLNQFKQRTLSGGLGFNPILSSSEMADLYHFPYTDITKVEGLVKSKSKDLPTPLSMKKSTTKLDVIVGKNSYGGEENSIGLTLNQRRKHMYILGKTGMGKTTLIENMIYQDIKNGKGLMYIDPHGDSFKRLLSIIPKERKKDMIVLNPADRKYPFGLNILSPGIEFEDEEEGQEWISSAAISVFLKLTDKEYWGPRLEHILRNTILTALQTENPQLYVIQKLLTTLKYQKIIASKLKDPILKQFWAEEFSLMGNMQQSNAISPITHRIGKFITNKISRHILLQEKSTISIQKAMDDGKIILVNLSKGELGEDVSSFFGSVLLSMVQLCGYQRLHILESERRDFFVYVDEFQNFATPTFSQMFSEGRKFRVCYILSHQDINQIDQTKDIKIIAGNAGTITVFRASPDDESFILPYMDPEVEKGEIVNLSPHHFFMTVTSDEAEDAFSGETTIMDVKGLQKTTDEITDYTRKHYANDRTTIEKQIEEMIDEIENLIKSSGKNAKPQTTNTNTIKPNVEKIKDKKKVIKVSSRVKRRGIK